MSERSTAARGAARLAWVALVLLSLALVVLGIRQRWYSDDVFVTFRYGWNLAHGHGIAWNAGGPHVEGSLSLGWTLVSAVVNALGLDPVLAAWTLGLLAAIVGLFLVYGAGRDLLGLSPGWALVAPAMLALSRHYVTWAVSADETRTATVLAFGATLYLARSLRRDPPRWIGPGALFFAATVFRPEAPLWHVAAAIGFAVAAPVRPKLVAIGRSLALHAGLLALLTGFRLAYFGHALPNAVAARPLAMHLDQGLRALAQFPIHTHGWLWAPLILIGLAVAAPLLPDLAIALLVQLLVVAAGVALFGGSLREFGALDPVMPAFALLLVVALGALLRLRGDPPARNRAIIFALVALVLIGSQAATSFTPLELPPPGTTREALKAVADVDIAEALVLAQYLEPTDRIATSRSGAIPFLARAWDFDPRGINAAGPKADATWNDMVRNGVMFVDIYDKFLYPQPVPPERLPRVTPWVQDGITVYCVLLPQGRDPYWIFASPTPHDGVEAWAVARGLRLVYARPLGARSPTNVPELIPAP